MVLLSRRSKLFPQPFRNHHTPRVRCQARTAVSCWRQRTYRVRVPRIASHPIEHCYQDTAAAVPCCCSAAAMAALSTAVIWEHERVAQFIQGHEYSRITLQFPDDLLQHAPAVAQELQQLLVQNGSGAKVRATAALCPYLSASVPIRQNAIRKFQWPVAGPNVN